MKKSYRFKIITIIQVYKKNMTISLLGEQLWILGFLKQKIFIKYSAVIDHYNWSTI